jgi:hypothetical protein
MVRWLLCGGTVVVAAVLGGCGSAVTAQRHTSTGQTGGSTGLLSQLAQEGGGSAKGVELDEAAVDQARRAAGAAPTSAAKWDLYALAVFRLADANYVTGSQGFTSAGAHELEVLKSVWNRYLALNPTTPDAALAADVAFAFGSSGLGEYSVAETAQQIVSEDNPTSYKQYAELAYYAYLSHDAAVAELAQAKALSLAPASERAQLKSELNEIAVRAG